MEQAFRFQRRLAVQMVVRALLVCGLGLGGLVGWPAAGARAASGSSLQIDVPKAVRVGEPIDVVLTLRDVTDVAGYEATLLFDTSAAEFAGLTQRQNDLKKFGRDVGPLGAVQLPQGVALGLYSCPTSDCVSRQGTRTNRGGRGVVTLARATLIATQPGALEIKLDAAKFVDAAGTAINVVMKTPSVTVQVGPTGPARPAPAKAWALSAAKPANATSFDLTGDGLVTHADAMEGAVAWTDARERGAPCGNGIDPSRDTNRDGCIDVADVQAVASNYSAANALAPRATSQSATNEAPNVTTAALATWVVNSVADAADSRIGDGVCRTAANECTLRAAIAEANAHVGEDSITFNIPGSGVQTIQLASQLPTLNDATGPTTIDGYTQPGSSPNTDPLVSNAVLRVEVVGTGENNFLGLRATSSGNVIRGLSLYKFTQAVRYFGPAANDNVVTGCFIGTNVAATYAATVTYPGKSGVHMQQGASRNRVGGTTLAERNVISGNAHHGVTTYDEGTNSNVIYNNIIGLSPAGDRRLPNRNHGVDVNYNSAYTVVGGTGPNERNVVSGNGFEGVELSHGAGIQNQVIGNYIGTDVTGTRATAYSYNVDFGVHIEDVSRENVVAYNVIGNNRGGGMNITSPFTRGNVVYGNRIGISTDGTPIPNANFGVQINNTTTQNRFGPDNIVAYNPVGVRLTSTAGTANTITRNSIFENTELGIDISPLGAVNPNDAGDGDSGPNDMLNFPVLTKATTAVVEGTACVTCTVEVFLADGGATAFGEGKQFVGAGPVNGDGTFQVPVTGVAANAFVTATATDATGNTSEFARNLAVVDAPRQPITYAADTFSRTVVDDWGVANVGGAYTLTGTKSNFDVNGSAGTMLLPAAGNNRTAALGSVSAQNVDVTVRVQTDKTGTGNGLFAYAIARRVNATTQYQGVLRFTTTGSVVLQAASVVNGAETRFGTAVTVPGLQHRANSPIWLRMQVTGTNPTTIRLKAWADGQAEPEAWQYTATDSTASLQAPGAVGLRAFVSSNATNAPVVFTFDDFRAVEVLP